MGCDEIKGQLPQMIICSQVNARRKAMLSAFEKHNKLMSEAQEGNGQSI